MPTLADAPAWARAMLRDARVGRLATADLRGRPLVVPVCFALSGNVIYSAIDAKPKRDPSRPLRRVRNVLENPRAALVIDEYDEDWRRLRYVIVEGPTTVLPAGAELEQAIEALTTKYDQYRAMGLSHAGGTMIRLTVERLVPWRWDSADREPSQSGPSHGSGGAP
jgi:PPOX class probable F420-dependent enzyme